MLVVYVLCDYRSTCSTEKLTGLDRRRRQRGIRDSSGPVDGNAAEGGTGGMDILQTRTREPMVACKDMTGRNAP